MSCCITRTVSVSSDPFVPPESPITNFYTHDGNKNVSEVIASDTDVAAHYEYAPFGALTISRGASAYANPWRFSSEYAEDDTATVYYNYRHYDPVAGRWMQRDPIEETGCLCLYSFCRNDPLLSFDNGGLFTPLQLIGGAVIGAAIGGISAAVTGGDVWAGIGGGLIAGACTAVCPAAAAKCAAAGGAISGFISGVRSANKKKLCGVKWVGHVVVSIAVDATISGLISHSGLKIKDGLSKVNPMGTSTSILQNTFFGFKLEAIVDESISSISVGISSKAVSTVIDLTEAAVDAAKSMGEMKQHYHEEMKAELDFEFTIDE